MLRPLRCHAPAPAPASLRRASDQSALTGQSAWCFACMMPGRMADRVVSMPREQPPTPHPPRRHAPAPAPAPAQARCDPCLASCWEKSEMRCTGTRPHSPGKKILQGLAGDRLPQWHGRAAPAVEGARQGRGSEARQVLQQALLHARQPQRHAVVALRLIVRAPQRVLALPPQPRALTTPALKEPMLVCA